MIKKEVLDALNEQINAETYSAYMYLSMAAYFENMGLSGFAHWMKIQYQEEAAHALKFFNYLTDRGGRVILKTVDQVPVDFDGILDVYEKTLVHVQRVSKHPPISSLGIDSDGRFARFQWVDCTSIWHRRRHPFCLEWVARICL